MKMCVPATQERVSPIFDDADSLLVVEVEGKKEITRHEHLMDKKAASNRVQYLKDLGVKVLICGSVTNSEAAEVSRSGITLIPWISGSIDRVIEDFLDGKIPDSSLYLP